jgi:hypothetical protein
MEERIITGVIGEVLGGIFRHGEAPFEAR